ncbi:MAG TPA: hypothetical protein VI461_06330, partial [Chitinophagaceae bacterium]|nr:hypothetical protein [Chitinophagaceae bacterium]
GTIIHNYPHSYSARHYISVWKKFITWCNGQQENRLGWLAASFIVHGCIFVPMTIVVIAMSGNNFIFIALTLSAMIAAVTVNLAALPTKITLPVFFFSLALDIIIIIACLLHGLTIAKLFTR